MNNKKIIFYSSNRADFTYIKNIIIKVAELNRIYLVVLNDDEREYREINKESLLIRKIQLVFIKNNESINNKLVKINSKIRPNFNFLVGDRKEMVIPALISSGMNIPIIHLGGGEKTLHSPDENFRKIISKLSKIHFCSTSIAKKRLENINIYKNTYVVGVTSYEELSNKNKEYEEKLFKKLTYDLDKIILFSFHSESNDFLKEIKLIKFTLNKLIKLNNHVIITESNNDFNGIKLNNYYKNINNKKISFIKNIGHKNYKYYISNCIFMIGNSSSGIVESSLFNKINLSIGLRQKGRDLDKNTYYLGHNLSKINIHINLIKENKLKYNNKRMAIYKKIKSSNVITKIISKL